MSNTPKTVEALRMAAGVGSCKIEAGSLQAAKPFDLPALLADIEKAKADRAAEYPTEKDALREMFEAFQRLGELGWRDAIYGPKDGTIFEAIEAGSTGIHDCFYMGDWPKGYWYGPEGGDLWPMRPILFRVKAKA